jgi:hypothetical protein
MCISFFLLDYFSNCWTLFDLQFGIGYISPFYVCFDNLNLVLSEFYLRVSFIQLLDLHLPMQSVHITSNVASSNPAEARCSRYNIMW